MKLSDLKYKTVASKEGRKKAIERLEKQLKDGTKPNRNEKVPYEDFLNGLDTFTKYRKKYPTVPLTTKDIERINKEIEVLKTRI